MGPALCPVLQLFTRNRAAEVGGSSGLTGDYLHQIESEGTFAPFSLAMVLSGLHVHLMSSLNIATVFSVDLSDPAQHPE